jgi:hypothetical protein
MKSRLLCFVLLLPLLYCSVRQPDWGDDFAQYLLQTRNIAEGRPMADNGVMRDPALPAFAVPAYPVGFPLLLLPFYTTGETATAPYFIVPAMFLVLAGFAYFLFSRKRFGTVVSLISALLIAYHPVYLQAKTELLSDLPFLAFLLLGFHWLAVDGGEQAPRRRAMLAGLFFGAALCMRLTGLALLPALLAWMLSGPGRRQAAGTATVVALGCFFFFNSLLFPIELSGIGQFYRDAIGAHPLLLREQFLFYLHQLSALFWFFPSDWGGALLCTALMIYYVTNRKSLDPADWFLLVYGGLLLSIPYQGSGLRFLLPVFPILLRNLLTLIRPLAAKVPAFRVPMHLTYALVAGLLVFPGILNWLKGADSPDGPESEEGKQFLEIVRKETPADAVLVCAKPRAIRWYTGRRATYLIDGVDPVQHDSAFVRLGARYLVSETAGRPGAFYDEKMNAYLAASVDRYAPLDSTKRLVVWSRK